MKVLLVNGSPNEKGCTFTALNLVADALKANGVDADFFWIGGAPIGGCHGDGACAKLGRCGQDGDSVNKFLAIAGDYDGFVFGAPVHFAAINGAMSAFMDRAFFADGMGKGGRFAFKPAAGICVQRRAGAVVSVDELNKYFMIRQMPVVSSTYWNLAFGMTPDAILADAEGVKTMKNLGRNMAWLIKSIAAGKAAGINRPE